MFVDRRGPRDAPYGDDNPIGAGDRRRASSLHRFLGGSPAGVVLRLLFLSALAGAVMAMLGLTPGRLFWNAFESARALAAVGFASVHEFGGWLLAGAIVVVPLWLIGRVFAVSR